MPRTVPSLLAAAVALAVGWSAAVPAEAGPALGVDISYPDCTSLPATPAFAVVGVNGGIASTANTCLSTELAWARAAAGGTSQPKIQLYVNTGNPMNATPTPASWTYDANNLLQYASRPDYANPYGTCRQKSGTIYGEASAACAYLYGWDRAHKDMSVFFPPAATSAGIDADPAAYVWWLDVETVNSWASGSNANLRANVAALEGMAKAFVSRGVRYGIYSTAYQWGVITGSGSSSQVKAGSPLTYVLNWYTVGGPYSTSDGTKKAIAACKNKPLTAGSRIVLTQFWTSTTDYDYSCTG